MREALLSPYGRASTAPSPVARMMASFAADFRDGVDINLGVGYVSEDAIPRQRIEQALQAVLADPKRYRAACNYGGPEGSPNLIASLRRFLAEQRVGGLDEHALVNRRLIIGVSGATSLLEAAARVLPPGMVVTTDPIYYIFCDLLERCGHSIVAVPEDAQGMCPRRLEARLAELGDAAHRVSFVYLVSVSNPTCTVLSTPRRQELVRIVAGLSQGLGRKVPLIVDTAYELLAHDPAMEKPQSALLFDDMGLVYEVGTLSKILAPALRVGYMIGPDDPLLRAIVQSVSDVGFSAPLLNQEIASYLLDHHAAAQVADVNQVYRRKALAVGQWIDRYLGPYLAERRGGSAGFYYYLTFRDVPTHEDAAFCRFLSRTTGDRAIDGPRGGPHPRVVYVPGEFCVHRGGEMVEVGRRQLRLSYGFEDLPRIEEGLRLMGDAAAYAGRR